MISASEKKNFIKQFLKTCMNTDKAEKEKLYELLRRDTIGTKLYKYRTVRKYNLQSICDGALYCAPAKTFNDPFDSKMGLTVGGIVNDSYEGEIEKTCDLLDKTVSVFAGESNLSEYTESEQRVMASLLKDEGMRNLLNKGRHFDSELSLGSTLSLEDWNAILNAFAKTTDNLNTQKQIELCKEKLPELIQRFPVDPFTSEDIDFQSLWNKQLSEYGDEKDLDEIDKVLSLSKGVVTREEYEAAEESILRLEEMVVSPLLNRFLVGCLATDYKNRLMWSHYADSHKGFCVEYDYSIVNPSSMENLPLPILYSSFRPHMPLKAAFSQTKENMEETTRYIIEALLTKDKAWEYENEWRILISGDSGKLISMPPITCIYLGANMNKINKGRIKKIAREHGIPVKQMQIDRGEYELHAKEI